MGYCTGVMHMALKEAGVHDLIIEDKYFTYSEFQQLLDKNYYKRSKNDFLFNICCSRQKFV